jgi:hypothetical protein
MLREIYDRNWFNYTVVYKEYVKPVNTSINRMTEHGNEEHKNHQSNIPQREYRILQINERGLVEEVKTFVLDYSPDEDQFLYFNTEFDAMIELKLVKMVKQVGVYKLSQRKANYHLYQWDKREDQYNPIKHLNAPE